MLFDSPPTSNKFVIGPYCRSMEQIPSAIFWWPHVKLSSAHWIVAEVSLSNMIDLCRISGDQWTQPTAGADKNVWLPMELDTVIITMSFLFAYCLTRLNPIPREAPRMSMTLFLRNLLNLTFSLSMLTPVFLPLAILCEDLIMPLRVTMLSGRSACRHTIWRAWRRRQHKIWQWWRVR